MLQQNLVTVSYSEQIEDLKPHQEYYEHVLDSIRKVRAAEKK